MRVITGSARGRRLITLEGESVRPTTDKVKEAMFSAIQFEIEGRQVLDLFAGSGQLAVEALSRGAAHAVLVDAAKSSLAVAEKNLTATGLMERARLVNSDSCPIFLPAERGLIWHFSIRLTVRACFRGLCRWWRSV